LTQQLQTAELKWFRTKQNFASFEYFIGLYEKPAIDVPVLIKSRMMWYVGE